jgi:small-conductance mechanosensitive channel
MSFDLTPALDRIYNMADSVVANLPNLILAVFVFALLYPLARMAASGISKLAQRQLETPGAAVAIYRLTKGGLLLVALLIALSVAIPSFKPGDVIQLLGITSVAFGFAFRDIFSPIYASSGGRCR